MSEPGKPRLPLIWVVLGALVLVAVCLRALVRANCYGDASDQLRLELVVSTVVTAIVSAAVIMVIIYVGERPGRVRAQRVAQQYGPEIEVWAARADSRSRTVLAAMSRAAAGELPKPGLYFAVAFDAAGMRIVTSTKESSTDYFVPRERIRRVRSLEYRVSYGRSNSISVTFEGDGKRFDLPLVLVEWIFISHHPIGHHRNASKIDHLRHLWRLDSAFVD